MADLDTRHHIRFGLVHEFVRKTLKTLRQRARRGQLEFPAFNRFSAPDRFDDAGHDLNALGMLLLDSVEQFDLALGHELEPVEVIVKLIELTQGGFEHPLLRR